MLYRTSSRGRVLESRFSVFLINAWHPVCGTKLPSFPFNFFVPSLRIKILEMFSAQSLHSVLSRLIEPPRTESLRASKLRLQDLGALTADEKLTPLGYHLASLPVDVRIGKLMLFGTIFRCLDPALTIAASLAFKSPFVSILNYVSSFESSTFSYSSECCCKLQHAAPECFCSPF